MKPGNIPTQEVGPILGMLVNDRWPHGGGYEILAEKVGCDQSTIASIIDQRNPGVSFDFADSLFCALGRPMEDVGLGDIYWNVDLPDRAVIPPDPPEGGLLPCGHKRTSANSKPEPRENAVYWRCRTCANRNKREARLRAAA